MSDVTESCWSLTYSDCNTVTVTVNYLTSIILTNSNKPVQLYIVYFRSAIASCKAGMRLHLMREVNK